MEVWRLAARAPFKDAEATQRFVRKRSKRMLRVAIRHVKPIANGEALDGVHLIGNNGIEPVNIDLTLTELTAALLSDCFSRKDPAARGKAGEVHRRPIRLGLAGLEPADRQCPVNGRCWNGRRLTTHQRPSRDSYGRQARCAASEVAKTEGTSALQDLLQ
jgi:hypothetical protein